MPDTVQGAQPHQAGQARFVDRIKAAAQKKTATVREWYDRRGSGCFRSMAESESEDSAAPVEEFLANTAGPEFRGSKRRQPDTRSDSVLKTTERQHEHPEALVHIPSGTGEHPEVSIDNPYRAGSLSSFSTTLDMHPGAASSTVSLLSTFSMGPVMVPELGAYASFSHPNPHFVIDRPDDFERFRSDLRNAVELDSVPASPAKPQPRIKCFNIDSTPIPADEERHGYKFKAYPGRLDTDNQGTATFQAYSAGSKLKHGSVGYIPPTLQSGFVHGVPPVLRATHNGNDSARHQNTTNGVATGHTSQSYSWPLVDLHKEIFLNADPSQTNHSTRYQEPRIPSIEFTGRGLEDEMKTVLDNLRIPVVTRAAEDVQDRAWMSPGSPLHPTAYEREARCPVVTVQAGVHPRVLAAAGTSHKHEASTGSGPLPSTEDRRVKFSEYNWPRFSDDQFTDPAEEYSREYRRRRREARIQTTRRAL
ncbi:hypothetical protein AYL99_07501 [Fonsecaea erecta]|uniref:Uncharacterized protein n=1 Tax=Fonsecaea erecta TaxID=1367422 RepID=A0A178ZG09_9EURO|nr:hypothetical protein AYL99_07501 [Fonsecaea erecta]OAP58411.1 hypothetical protein AYL99_07501 [Fonsecaea erecta]